MMIYYDIDNANTEILIKNFKHLKYQLCDGNNLLN